MAWFPNSVHCLDCEEPIYDGHAERCDACVAKLVPKYPLFKLVRYPSDTHWASIQFSEDETGVLTALGPSPEDAVVNLKSFVAKRRPNWADKIPAHDAFVFSNSAKR